MKKLLLLTLSLGAISQLSAGNVSKMSAEEVAKSKADSDAAARKAPRYTKPIRSSSNSCGKLTGNLQILSVGNFNISTCANDYKFERSAVLAELQNEIQKELGAESKQDFRK